MGLRQNEALSPQVFIVAVAVINEPGIIGLPMESVCVDDLSLTGGDGQPWGDVKEVTMLKNEGGWVSRQELGQLGRSGWTYCRVWYDRRLNTN